MAQRDRRPRRRSWAGSRASCSATATPTTAAPRRGSACRSSATRRRAPTPRATAALHYFDLSKLDAPGALRSTRGCCAVLGRRAGRDRRHGRRGRRGRGLPGRAPARPRARADRRCGASRDRLALTSDCFYTLDPQTGRHGPAARAARRLQPRHRAGARVDPQARRARARGRLARPRRPADRRRARAARAGGRGA